MTRSRSAPRRARALLLPLAAAFAACSSPPKVDPHGPAPAIDRSTSSAARSSSSQDEQERVFVETNRDPLVQPIGFFLAELDRRMQAWNRVALEPEDPRRQSQRELFAEELRYWTRSRRDELVLELMEGPPRNRSIAATALGFSEDVEVLGPLLGALDDPSDLVKGNALNGLGLLGIPETPLDPICSLLRVSSDPWVRNNAAFALQRLVQVGARGDCVVETCRQGLLDAHDGVRVQCARILALLGDTEAVPMLGNLLFDDVALVTAAAASSLSLIGRENLEHKGECGRLLANSLDRVGSGRREQVLYELAQLADSWLGEDSGPWRAWARKLP